MRGPEGRAPRGKRLARVALALAVAGLPRAVAAQTPPPSGAEAPKAAAADAPMSEAARSESQGEAAQRAAQELEVRVIELQRQLDALARQRASYDDVRRRLDELEARQAEAARGRALGDWASVPGSSEAIRFNQGGFVIRSPNGRFLLRPGMRLQTIYEARFAGAGPSDGARQDSSAFTLAHAELILEGHAVSRAFEYRFELDFADIPAGTNPATGAVKDAFVQGVLGEWAAVRVGRVRVPFGFQPQLWNGYQELVDVSQATRAFSLDRDVGLMATGRPLGRRLHYQLAVLDGPRTCPADTGGLPCDPVDLAYAGRIAAAPFGPLPATEGDEEGHSRPLLQIGVSADTAYRIGCPDVLEIAFADHPEWNVYASVDLDGRVQLAHPGSPRVEGRTLEDARHELARLASVDPDRVTVHLAAARSSRVFLHGPIRGRCRVVPYQGPEPVIDFLKRVGGLPPGSKLNQVYVVRPNIAVGARPEVFQVDVPAVLVDNNQTTNVPLKPSDEVYIGETKRSVFARILPDWLGPMYRRLAGLLPDDWWPLSRSRTP